jgi:hypothetical protein
MDSSAYENSNYYAMTMPRPAILCIQIDAGRIGPPMKYRKKKPAG